MYTEGAVNVIVPPAVMGMAAPAVIGMAAAAAKLMAAPAATEKTPLQSIGTTPGDITIGMPTILIKGAVKFIGLPDEIDTGFPVTFTGPGEDCVILVVDVSIMGPVAVVFTWPIAVVCTSPIKLVVLMVVVISDHLFIDL